MCASRESARLGDMHTCLQRRRKRRRRRRKV
jgi:hypothetical protein